MLIEKYCPSCDAKGESHEIWREATTRWDGEDWVIAHIYNTVWCTNCSGDEIAEREITPPSDDAASLPQSAA